MWCEHREYHCYVFDSVNVKRKRARQDLKSHQTLLADKVKVFVKAKSYVISAIKHVCVHLGRKTGEQNDVRYVLHRGGITWYHNGTKSLRSWYCTLFEHTEMLNDCFGNKRLTFHMPRNNV